MALYSDPAAACRARPTRFFSLYIALGLICCVTLAGCGAERDARPPIPAGALETDGPTLALAGEYQGMALTGEMDRTCMVGFGKVALRTKEDQPSFACEALIDDPPTEKGRVRGVLRCTDKRNILFTLRNTGPDQGVGIGRETAEGELMVLFYHPSREEAERRLPQVAADMEKARRGKNGAAKKPQ